MSKITKNMSYNREIYKDSLDEITKETFKEAVFLAYRDGVSSVAPLGFSGDDILLYGDHAPRRCSLVSIRNHSGDPKMLVTDTKGRFLFYGGFEIRLGLEFCVDSLWDTYLKVRPYILTELGNAPDFSNVKISENASISDGFEMLRIYQLENHGVCETCFKNENK